MELSRLVEWPYREDPIMMLAKRARENWIRDVCKRQSHEFVDFQANSPHIPFSIPGIPEFRAKLTL